MAKRSAAMRYVNDGCAVNAPWTLQGTLHRTVMLPIVKSLRCADHLRHGRAFPFLLCALFVLTVAPGCRSWRERRAARKSAPSPRRTIVTPQAKPAHTSHARREPSRQAPEGAPIRQVVCLFDQRPWLSLDTAGDRDPEGLQFRVFLDGGSGRGVLREGTFHVEMYRIVRLEKGDMERKLASDWHFTTDELATVRANILGDGYLLQLRWANKDVASGEVEIFVRFETPEGESIRSGTKRFRVPKYSS